MSRRSSPTRHRQQQAKQLLLLPMAFSFRPLPLRPSVSYPLHRAKCHAASIASSVGHPVRAIFGRFPGHSVLIPAFGRSKYSNIRSSDAQEKQQSICTLCSLQEGYTADEQIGKRRGPSLQWIFVAVSVVTAGLFLFVKWKGQGWITVEGSKVLAPVDGGLVTASPGGAARFHVKLPGLGLLSLEEATPGWVYFLLLMAAGFGFFVSEEALNVWVGASLGRLLYYGSSETFLSSLMENAPYILSTILWVYWGVCISDMVPFFAGKLASQRGDQLSKKLGVNKEQYEKVTSNIQRFGNLIGFVERFSLGVRNPTSFLAGFAGISPSRFFAGVCLGGLFTLPIQMSIGFLLRERPVAALAGVAAVVASWTVFPYAAAGIASMYYLLQHKFKRPS